MSTATPALLTLFLLTIGALLSRLAPRKETRAVAVAHASLALFAAIVSVLIEHSSAESAANVAFGGVVVINSVVTSMLAPLAAVALGLVLAMPVTESGHRSVSQSLALPALVVASLLCDQLATVVWLDVCIALASVAATEARARKAVALVRSAGAALVLAGLMRVPVDLWFAPLEQVVGEIEFESAALMLAGVALHIGVGPASLGLRAAFCDGLTARAVLTSLPLGGMALLLRIVGPAFGHSASEPVTHATLLAVLVCALVTGALVLVQRTVGSALALLLATASSLALTGLIELDPGASMGGELLWAATLLAGGGLSVSLLALRARHGRLPVDQWGGFYSSSPGLAAFVLFFAVALGGLPGTLNFAALDLVLHGDVSHRLDTLLVGTSTMAVAGFATVRLAFHLLFGAPPTDGRDNDMPLLQRERYALAPLALLLLLAGLVPTVLPVVRSSSDPVSAPSVDDAAVSGAGDE